MSELRIRRMAAGDLDETVGVWERSRWQAQPELEERMNHSHDENLRHFRDVVEAENEVWLATEDGCIVGLVALGSGQIDQLYVEPRSQRRGVGTALLEKAKALFPRGLALYTHQRNENARAFYEAQGFQAVEFGVSPAPESEPDVRYVWEPGAKPGPAA